MTLQKAEKNSALCVEANRSRQQSQPHPTSTEQHPTSTRRTQPVPKQHVTSTRRPTHAPKYLTHACTLPAMKKESVSAHVGHFAQALRRPMSLRSFCACLCGIICMHASGNPVSFYSFVMRPNEPKD